MHSDVYLFCFAIYFLVAFIAQFFLFRNYEAGKEDLSDDTIVAVQICIWFWPLWIIYVICIFIAILCQWSYRCICELVDMMLDARMLKKNQ